MNESLEDKRNKIKDLIKNISNDFGGDIEVWTDSYIKDVLIDNKNDIDKALACFEDLAAQKKTITCQKCGYNPPFCLCDYPHNNNPQRLLGKTDPAKLTALRQILIQFHKNGGHPFQCDRDLDLRIDSILANFNNDLDKALEAYKDLV